MTPSDMHRAAWTLQVGATNLAVVTGRLERMVWAIGAQNGATQADTGRDEMQHLLSQVDLRTSIAWLSGAEKAQGLKSSEELQGSRRCLP